MKYVKRYKLFIVLLFFNMILLLILPELGTQSLLISFDNFKEMLSILPPIFILLGLLDVWIPKETMMKYMGKDAGIKGMVLSFLLGSFSAGPLYASFPIAAVFLNKGVSLMNVFIFIGAWSSTKIPMMLFEVSQLGIKFAVTRFVINLVGIVVIAYIMDKTSKNEYDEIMENVQKQTQEK